jgi:hypothetical protein
MIMRHTFAAAWALGLATLATAQAPQTNVTTYDARPLLRGFKVTELPHNLPLHATFAGVPANFGEGRVIDEERLVEFLRTAAGTEEAQIEVSGGQVVLKGTPAAQQTVGALMNHLSRVLLQELTVEVYSLQAAPDAATGVLSAAEVERVLGVKGAPVELARTTALLGQPCHVRAGKGISFVSDYDVEVAQSAAIGDPVIRVLQEGLDFQATVGQSADGRLLVRFGSTRCALAEALTPRTVASTRLGDIQLPKVRSSIVVGSGFLEDGGALVARHDGGLGTGIMVRVRRSSNATTERAGSGHHVLFVDDLLGSPQRVAIPSVRDDQRNPNAERDPPAEPLVEEPEGVVTRELLEDYVRNALGEDGQTSVDLVGTRIHLRGSDDKAARVREAVAALAKGLSKNVVVDFKVGKLDASAQPLPKNPDDLAAKLTGSISIPVSMSDQFLIAGGLEQSAIIDQDVEIAQQSQIADPIVAPLFDGWVMSGVASAAGSDRLELLLDFQHREVLPFPSSGLPSRAENVGSIDLPQVDGAGGRYKLLLEPGKWTVVTASNPGETSALVVVARARW